MARGKWLSSAERERILELQRDGLSIGAIAARVNRSYHFVYRHLRGKTGFRRRADEGDDRALHPTRKRVKLSEAVSGADSPAELMRATSECSVAMPTWTRLVLSPCEPLVVSASPLVTSPIAMAQDALEAVDEDDDSCEPIPFSPLGATGPSTCTFAHPFGQSSPVHEFREAPVERYPPPATEIRDDEGPSRSSGVDQTSLARTVTPMEPPKLSPTWVNANDFAEASVLPEHHEEYDLPTAHGAGAEPERELANTSLALSGLFSNLQDEICRLSRPHSIGFYDAQLLQLLVQFQADVLLLTRQRSCTDNADAYWDGDNQPEVEQDDQDGDGGKVMAPSWIPADDPSEAATG